jgi:hypothetical protein
LQLAAVTEPACKDDLQMLCPKINSVQVCKHRSWCEYPNWQKNLGKKKDLSFTSINNPNVLSHLATNMAINPFS